MVVGTAQFAELVGLSVPCIMSYIQQGLPLVSGDGKRGSKIDSAAGVQWLRDRDKAGTPAGDLGTEKLRLAKAQADLAEIEVKVESGKLVSLEEQGKQWDDTVLRIRSRLLALPGRAAQFVGLESPAVAQKLMKTMINEVLEELTSANK